MPTYRVTDPTTGQALRLTGDSAPTEKELEEIFSQQPKVQQVAQQQPDDGQDYGTVGNAILELASAMNRGGADLLDFFTVDQINNVMQLTGSDKRVPTFSGALESVGATQGGYMDPGMARDIVQQTGETVTGAVAAGGLLRQAAKQLPRIAPAAESLGSSFLRQLGVGTTAGDIALSGVSAAGGEVGEELGGDYGKLVGAVLAPIGGVMAKDAFKRLLASGKAGIQSLMRPLAEMSDDGASTLLAEAMVRENLSPAEALKILDDLGPEAIPADIGNNFARLLRTASNKIPRIEGTAANVLKARQSGQGDRILSAFDDSVGTKGLNIDDEIARLNTVMKPKITAIYNAAGEKGIQLSDKLRTIMVGKNSLGRAQRKVQRRLADKRAVGDEITNIDVIDASKQELDDQIGKAIRQGEMGKVRDLTRLKNTMVDEADAAIPEYKQARDMFAGKASMENAAKMGELFLKTKPRDMLDITKTFGQSEKAMYKLGAKQAILDKIDDLYANADAVRRLFGKNGDIKKLRHLFDYNEQFNKFSKALQKEADFILTRRAAQANSTTAKQLSDDASAFEALSDAAAAISTPAGATNMIRKVVSGLGKNKADADYIKALEDVGDILLTKGMDATKLQALLRRGNTKQLESALRSAMKGELSMPYAPASISGGIEATEDALITNQIAQ